MHQPKTQFVRNRLRETPWNEKRVITDLLGYEEVIDKGGPHNMGGANLCNSRERNYPVECECIRDEIRLGHIVDDEEYSLRLRKREDSLVEEKRRVADLEPYRDRIQQVRHERQMRVWLAMGGLPQAQDDGPEAR